MGARARRLPGLGKAAGLRGLRPALQDRAGIWSLWARASSNTLGLGGLQGGYTPGVFAKSAEAIDCKRFSVRSFARACNRVRNVVIPKELSFCAFAGAKELSGGCDRSTTREQV